MLFSKRVNLSLAIAIPLVLFSYYFLAMYTELERLKLGFMFFLFSIYFYGRNKKLFYLLIVFSVLSHIQFILFYLVLFSPFFYTHFKRFIAIYKLHQIYVLLVPFFIVFFVIFYDHVYAKFSFYYSTGFEFDYFSVVKMLPFFVFSLFYSKKSYPAVLCWLILLLLIFILGGSRLNIFGFFLFLFFAADCRRGLNLGVFLSLFYFISNGVLNFNNIIEVGRFYPY